MPEYVHTKSTYGIRNLVQNFKSGVMQKSRNNKLEHFYSVCAKNSSVLDVGVTGYLDYNPQVNLFLSNFRFNSDCYTGLAIEPVDQLKLAYPDKNLYSIPEITSRLKIKFLNGAFPMLL